ncbi:MAG: ABC transporter ATP-binding protein, partial [Promethearchaeota archaeon]
MAYYGLDAEEYDRIYSDKQLISRIIKIFKPYRKSMFIIIIFMVLNSFCYGALPLLTRGIIEQLDQSNYIIPLITLTILVTLG